jgi:hypothetical protein
MSSFSKWIKVLVVASGLALTMAPVAQAAHDEGHTDDGHTDGGKGKGPKYMGGNSSQVHKGGSHHHDSSTGGSKATEDKIFHGHESDGGHDDGGTEHSH